MTATAVLIVMLQRWDSSASDSAEIKICIASLTAMATDSTVTAMSVATIFMVMCTLLSN